MTGRLQAQRDRDGRIFLERCGTKTKLQSSFNILQPLLQFVAYRCSWTRGKLAGQRLQPFQKHTKLSVGISKDVTR